MRTSRLHNYADDHHGDAHSDATDDHANSPSPLV